MSKNPKRSEVLESDALLTIKETAERAKRFMDDEALELLEIVRENCKNYDEMRYMLNAAYRNVRGRTANDIAEMAMELLEKEIAKEVNRLVHEPFPKRGEPPKGKTMSNVLNIGALGAPLNSFHIPHHVINELEKAQEQENERKQFIEKSMSDFAEFMETAERGTVSPMYTELEEGLKNIGYESKNKSNL